MISLDKVQVAIENVQVLRDFSLHLGAGTMTGLIGRNGAGKTTVMRTIMGHLPLLGGSLRLSDIDLASVMPHERARLGIGYMPEDRGLVP